MATEFEINGAAPSPTVAKPPGKGGEGCMIHFPDSMQRIRGDGHSVQIGKPWIRLFWPVMPLAGAAFYYDLFSDDVTPSVDLTSCSAYNPRLDSYTTYSGSAILHRPRYSGVVSAGNASIYYSDFEVWITELS